VLWTRPPTAARLCALCVATSFASRLVFEAIGAPSPTTFSWTFSRFDALAVGSFIAICYESAEARGVLQRLSMPIVAIGGAILGAVVLTGQAERIFETGQSAIVIAARSGMPLVAGFFLGALLISALTRPWLARALTGPIGSALARYSYGAYVFHLFLMPVYMKAFPVARLQAITGSADAGIVLFAAAGMLATLAFAFVSYHGFESFFLNRRPRDTARDEAVALPVPQMNQLTTE